MAEPHRPAWNGWGVATPLTKEALERLRVWLYPETLAPSAADVEMLGRLGILWP